MKNEIYEKLKAAQHLFQLQLNEIVKGIPELCDVRAYAKVILHEVPVKLMPEMSRECQDQGSKWLSYHEGADFPVMYSKFRKYKIVFDDEPETSNQHPVTSHE